MNATLCTAEVVALLVIVVDAVDETDVVAVDDSDDVALVDALDVAVEDTVCRA